MRRTVRIGAVAAALLAAAAARAQAPDPLTFCAGFDNLPMSEMGTPAGFEIEFAEALATRLGRQARFEWIDPHSDLVEDAVVEGRCEVALGAMADPGALVGARPTSGLMLTEPYYDAGYLLIRRAGARPAGALEELRDTHIAVDGHSTSIFTLRQRGYKLHMLHDYQAVIDALADGRAEYGYLWGPLAAWVTRHRNDVVLAKEFQPPDLWSFALAVREADTALREALNRGIREMVDSGSLTEIFSRYHVPYFAPAR